MRWGYLMTASLMTLKELFRRKIVILLLLLIPSVFYGITHVTTDMFAIPFKLASVEGEPVVLIVRHHAAVGGIQLVQGAIGEVVAPQVPTVERQPFWFVPGRRETPHGRSDAPRSPYRRCAEHPEQDQAAHVTAHSS